MKAFACAALAALAVADKSKFPKDDAFHADCHLTAFFEGKTCDMVYSNIETEIKAWNSDTTSPAAGVYTLKESLEGDYIWSTRLTKNKKYTDDQLFEFTESNDGCTVTGHSRSQSISYYDYSVNFCNLWNVYNGAGTFTQTVGKCGYPADDPVTTCATY